MILAMHIYKRLDCTLATPEWEQAFQHTTLVIEHLCCSWPAAAFTSCEATPSQHWKSVYESYADQTPRQWSL